MPEFDGDEYHWDRLQRYTHRGDGKVSAEDMMLYIMHLKEKELNVPEQFRSGQDLRPAQIDELRRVSYEVQQWGGTFELQPYTGDLTIALNQMAESIRYMRSHGKLVTFAAFDYIQILKAANTDIGTSDAERTLGLIKEFGMMHNVHSFVTTQTNKGATSMLKQSNKMLTAADMNYAREDVMNLIVTLNLVYNDDGIPCKVRGTDLNAGWAKIVKNNKGRTGKVKMVFDTSRL